MEDGPRIFSRRSIIRGIGIAAAGALTEGVLKPGIVRDSINSIVTNPQVTVTPTAMPTSAPTAVPTIVAAELPTAIPQPTEIQVAPTLPVLRPELSKSTEFTDYAASEVPYWFKDNFPQRPEVFNTPVLAGASFSFGGLNRNSLTGMGGYTLDSQNQRCVYTATHIVETFQSMREPGMMLTVPDFNSQAYRHFITSDLNSFEAYTTNKDGFAFSKIVPGSSLDSYLAQCEQSGLISPVSLHKIEKPLEEADSVSLFRPDAGWLKGNVNSQSEYSSQSWGIYMVEHEQPIGAYRDGLSGSTVFNEDGLAIGVQTNGLSKQDMRPELEQWHHSDAYGKNNPEFAYSNIMVFRTADACFSPDLS